MIKLLKAGASHKQNYAGETPLHDAARNGHLDAVRQLIKFGANVNAQSVPVGFTPLHFAAANGFIEIVIVLLNCGANVNTLIVTGQNAIDIAKNNEHDHVVKLLEA